MTQQVAPTVKEITRKVLPILARYGAIRAGIFGSAARGEMRDDSDVDFLVELDREKVRGLDYFSAYEELEKALGEALGRKVDLCDYHTIKTRIKERVLAHEVRIVDDGQPLSDDQISRSIEFQHGREHTMNRDLRLYIDDILESIDAIEEYTKGMTETEFFGNRLVQAAVERWIEIIGEAIRHIPVEFRRRYPEVPWQKISDMRNRIIHEYRDVHLDVIWTVVTEELGKLKPHMLRVLHDLEQTGGS